MTGSSEAERVTVVLVDDHALVRAGTAELLEREPDIEVVGQAGSGEEALPLVAERRPAVVVVDVQLPGMSGIDVVRALGERAPETRALVVSAYDDYPYVAAALEAGASGYLLKTASAEELVGAVRMVARGALVLEASVSRRLTRRWHDDSGPAPIDLTPRELDVLGLLAEGRANKQIAHALGLSLRTVEGYVSTILAKLGVSSRTEAALYALAHHLVDHSRAGGGR